MKFRFKGFLISAAIIVTASLMLGASDNHHSGKLVSETYVVQQGDTLWGISAKYIDKNTFGPREIREFYHGIIELNYEAVFAGRQTGVIYPGDSLKINYWVNEE